MKASINATAAEAKTALALQLHGKTKIELFDAANGAKIYEQIDENMVTNALQHLVNLPAELTVMDNVSNRNCLPALYMPFLSKALSGLWVFSKQLTENEEYISPSTADVKALTGYAGGEYSGSNSKRGSLNLNESGAIDKGYRYVWDFATDKANGTVSCVSLVPRVQGNLGDSSENNMSGLAFSMCDFLNYSTSDYQSGIAKFSNQIGHYSVGDGILASSTGGLLPVYAERSDRCVYIYAVSVKQGDVYKFPIVNCNAIQITDITGALDLRYKCAFRRRRIRRIVVILLVSYNSIKEQAALAIITSAFKGHSHNVPFTVSGNICVQHLLRLRTGYNIKCAIVRTKIEVRRIPV